MNTRIRPDDLNTAPYDGLIRTLALRLANAQLPAPISYLYLDYSMAISTLLLTTQSLERVEAIVRAVLDQAQALGKTSVWVENELKFEGMIDGADRADFLNFELSQAAHVDDGLLDAYNERLHRFSPVTHAP